VLTRLVLLILMLSWLASVLLLMTGRSLPRGDQLLFERDNDGIRDLWLADVPRAMIAPLTHTRDAIEEHAQWSPDGEYIAYAYQRGSTTRQICIRQPRPSSIPMCLNAAAYGDDFPRWSPDGSELLLTSITVEGGRELFRVVPGAQPRIVAFDISIARDYHWTEDGAYALYSGQPPNTGVPTGLWLLDARDNSRQFISAGGNMDWLPRPSPDGQSVTFIRIASTGTNDIYIMPASCLPTPDSCSTQALRLTHHEALMIELVWSPDGRQIAYVSNRDGRLGIYTYDLLTQAETGWTADNRFTHEDVAFSPAGSAIAYISDVGGDYDVYVQALVPGVAPVRLTDGERDLDSWRPQWRP
jgi:Tol biopolymer transport system component